MQATELYQFFKLPLLFEHLRSHRIEDPSITFMEFLRMHYNYKAQPDEDHDQDMRLPFKVNDACLTSSLLFIMHHPSSDMMPKVNLSALEPQVMSDEPLISSSYFSRIWQPPKSC